MNKERFIQIFTEFGLTSEWAEICWRNKQSDLDKIDVDLTGWDHVVMQSAEGWERYSGGGSDDQYREEGVALQSQGRRSGV